MSNINNFNYEQSKQFIDNLDQETYDSNSVFNELYKKLEVHNELYNDVTQKLLELELLSKNASPSMINEIKNELKQMMG